MRKQCLTCPLRHSADKVSADDVAIMGFGSFAQVDPLTSYREFARYKIAKTLTNSDCENLLRTAQGRPVTYTGTLVKPEMICVGSGGDQLCEVRL